MFLKRVYSEICVIRVQIFILVSLLSEFVTFRRKKGQRNLGVDHLGRLSDAMGVSSDFLLKGCSENSTLVCKMLDDLKKKLQPSK